MGCRGLRPLHKGKGRLTGLKRFGDRIQEQLWERIKEELKLPDKPPTDTETDPLAIEQDYHERFVDSRLNVYIGRDKIHKDLLAYLDGDDRKPLIVTGISGSGKSAILARLSREDAQRIFIRSHSLFVGRVLHQLLSGAPFSISAMS